MTPGAWPLTLRFAMGIAVGAYFAIAGTILSEFGLADAALRPRRPALDAGRQRDPGCAACLPGADRDRREQEWMGPRPMTPADCP
jgi:hypothetical protein